MPRKVGEKLNDRISISFSPLNKTEMEKALKNREFTNVANLVNTAISFYFENRNASPIQEQFKTWVVSEDGEKYMKNLMREFKKRSESK